MPFIQKLWVQIKTWQFKISGKSAQRKIKKFQHHDERLLQRLRGGILPRWTQLRHLGNFLSPTEKIIIRVARGILFVSVVALLLNLYLTNSQLVPKAGGIYTEGLIGSPRYVNPLFSQANDVDLDISALVYSGLFKFTERGLVKELAENYQISADQLSYTINLRADARWHDAEALDADDVIFTFNRIMNNKTKTPLYFNFQGVSVEKINERSVRFTLPRPFAPFLESLTVGILPEHIWKNIAPENMMLADYNLKPIGSGPYQFKSFAKNKNGEIKSYRLEDNPDYFNGAPYIEEISLRFYNNFEEAVEALNNKKVDAISYLPKEIRSRIINNRNLNFHLLSLPQYTAIFFNYDKNPILKDLTIRKILSHSVDKEKIVNEILNAEAQIIDAGILPGLLGHNPDIVKFPFNVQHARNELEKAGWKLTEYAAEVKDDKIENKGTAEETYPYPVRKLKNRFLEFSLTTVNQPETVKIATELQREWQQIGAKITLVIIDPENIQATINNRDYEAILYGQIPGLDPDPYPFWHSSQRNYPGLNLTSFSHSDADKLLEDARQTSDDKARADKYFKFQKLLAESVPAIFLFNPTYTYPQNKKIKGFQTSKILIPANRFSQIKDWYIKTDRKLGESK